MMRFGHLLCLVLLVPPTLLLADKGGLRAVRRLQRPVRPANGAPLGERPTRPRPNAFAGGGSATNPSGVVSPIVTERPDPPSLVDRPDLLGEGGGRPRRPTLNFRPNEGISPIVTERPDPPSLVDRPDLLGVGGGRPSRPTPNFRPNEGTSLIVTERPDPPSPGGGRPSRPAPIVTRPNVINGQGREGVAAMVP